MLNVRLKFACDKLRGSLVMTASNHTWLPKGVSVDAAAAVPVELAASHTHTHLQVSAEAAATVSHLWQHPDLPFDCIAPHQQRTGGPPPRVLHCEVQRPTHSNILPIRQQVQLRRRRPRRSSPEGCVAADTHRLAAAAIHAAL